MWLYGVNNSTFIDKNTGYEVGATWATLNGYNDNLKLETKEKVAINALFFDFNNEDNGGSIDLLITSNKLFFNSINLTIDSKRNCYVLDENYLSSLSQSGSNLIELNPGNYRLKIREGNASYWSDNKKFDLEPCALILLRGGKFITKLTRVEIEETWVSLNGLKDELVLEVKEKTTLTGLFFDTYKEDNEGQIILEIEPLSVDELTEKYKNKENIQVSQHESEKTFTSETVINGEFGTRELVGGNVTSESNSESGTRELVGGKNAVEFTFHFNEEEFKKKWEEQLQQINTSISVIDQAEVTLEAKYWDQLEKWLLKNYEKHFKNLSVEVAKIRFSMDAYMQQIEFSLNEQLQNWSGYLEKILEERINVEISRRINQQITQYIDQSFEQKIRNNISLITQNIANSSELNHYVSQKIDNFFEQKIQNHIQLITQNIINDNDVFNQYVDQRLKQTVTHNSEVNHTIVNLIANSTEINNKISHIRNEWNESFISLATEQVDELINVIGNEEAFTTLITHNIVNNNETLNQYVDRRLEYNVTNNNETLNQYIDRRLEHNVTNNNIVINQIFDNEQITQKIQKILNNDSQIHQTIESVVINSNEINNRILNFIVNSTEINNKINNVYRDMDIKIENVRKEWNQTFINLVGQYVDEMIDIIGDRDSFNIRIANAININPLLSVWENPCHF